MLTGLMRAETYECGMRRDETMIQVAMNETKVVWLSIDECHSTARSCLPVHVQTWLDIHTSQCSQVGERNGLDDVFTRMSVSSYGLTQ